MGSRGPLFSGGIERRPNRLSMKVIGWAMLDELFSILALMSFLSDWEGFSIWWLVQRWFYEVS